jgi:predicted permease
MGASLSAGARRFELRRFLLILQAAISMVLLVVAGLFLHSLDNAKAVNLGFTTDHVLVGSLNPRMLRYTAQQMNNFYRQLESRLRNVPGVQAVGMSSTRLLSGDINVTTLTVVGQPEPSGDRHIGFAWVNAGFFSATGVVLLRGRDFSAQDTMTSQRVAVVSESLVRYFFEQQEPVGRKVRIIGQDFEIIGVTRDAKYRKVIEETPKVAYLSQDQQPPGERTVYLRTAADPQFLVKPFRGEVQALDSSLPLFNIKTLADQKSESLIQERLLAKLSGFFGALALLLASIGLYGVMAYNVVRQTREIGIRMALGASRQALLLMVLRDGLLMVAIGLLAGIPLSLWLSRLLVGLLYGIAPHDPSTLITSALILMTVAALASCLPARRASRVDPITALRHE